jgi:hypothetical protein
MGGYFRFQQHLKYALLDIISFLSVTYTTTIAQSQSTPLLLNPSPVDRVTPLGLHYRLDNQSRLASSEANTISNNKSRDLDTINCSTTRRRSIAGDNLTTDPEPEVTTHTSFLFIPSLSPRDTLE